MRRLLSYVLVLAACGGDGPRAPTLERSSPDFGPLAGGTRIELAGAGFASDGAASNRVLIGGREAPLVATVDDGRLEVVIPPGERAGDAEIVVFNPNGSATATGLFHYSSPPAIASVAPSRILFSSQSTRVTITGTGFLDEGAGVADVLLDGQPATEVLVTSDGSLTFTAPPGPALVRPEIQVINTRGIAIEERGFLYIPGARGGLLLFPTSSNPFAVFFDPVDNSVTPIPRTGAFATRFTAVVRDDRGDYWGFDRARRFGRINMRTQVLEAPMQTQHVIPAMVRANGLHFAIERNFLRFGIFDPASGSIDHFGDSPPCCGSFGMAFDGTTLYFTGRSGADRLINTMDPTTGTVGTPVTLTAPPGFHVEDLRFFNQVLYASSRDGTFATIDPATGIVTLLPLGFQRYNAIEVFEP